MYIKVKLKLLSNIHKVWVCVVILKSEYAYKTENQPFDYISRSFQWLHIWPLSVDYWVWLFLHIGLNSLSTKSFPAAHNM